MRSGGRLDVWRRVRGTRIGHGNICTTGFLARGAFGDFAGKGFAGQPELFHRLLLYPWKPALSDGE